MAEAKSAGGWLAELDLRQTASEYSSPEILSLHPCTVHLSANITITCQLLLEGPPAALVEKFVSVTDLCEIDEANVVFRVLASFTVDQLADADGNVSMACTLLP